MNKANHNFISIFIWADSDDYVGCFVDSKRRLLPQQYKINGNGYHTDIENNRCLLYCKDQGYKYSGTEVIKANEERTDAKLIKHTSYI